MAIMDRIRGMMDFGGPKAVIEVDHADRIEDYDRPGIDGYIRSFVGKYEDIIPIQKLKIDIKVHNAAGKRDKPERKKYSMHATLFTGKEVMRTDAFGWDVFEVMDEIIHELRKQSVKHTTKARDISRDKRRMAKS